MGTDRKIETNTPTLFWNMAVAMYVVFFAGTIVLFQYMFTDPVAPEYAKIFIAVGLLSALPAYLYSNKQSSQVLPAMPGQADKRQKMVSLMIAYVLAEVPGLLGIGYFLVSRELIGTVFLFIVSFSLMMFTRPN